MNQTRVFPIAVLALAMALPAAAAGAARKGDVYYEQTTQTSVGGETTGPGVLSRVWFGGQRIRLESGGLGHGTALILRLDEGRAWRVDPVERTAERLDLDGLRAQSKTDAALAGELMGAGEPDSVRTTELPGKTIAGYRCRGYRLKSAAAVIDVYTTAAVPVSMEAFGEFLEWTGDLCRIVDSHAALLAALEESDRVLKAFVDGQGQRGSILLAARQANLAAIRKARGE